MFNDTTEDLLAVYNRLKDKYNLILTTTYALNEGFTIDCPIVVGKAHGQIIELYECGGDFVLDVMDEAQTMGTHWHPNDVEGASADIAEFMEGKSDYRLQRFPKPKAVTHGMKLHSAPFEMIKSGRKTIELRLFDEKRRKIKVGDSIVFTNTATGEELTAAVKKLHRFGSFEELYEALPLLQCGYTAEDIATAHPSDMEAYYSPEEQKKYGVVGIELAVLE